ncbi:MAG: metallophosphoesterase family protein [Saprospiraceae bacterium]
MKKIILLSDTHGFLDDNIIRYFEEADEVWHAGDIGSMEMIDRISAEYPLRAVWGNIDDQLMRRSIPEKLEFEIENFKVLMIHIAGKFGVYTPQVKSLIAQYSPDILVCGHSHILKIVYDHKNSLLYLNPGAAGISGFHKVRTLVRFMLHDKKISDMQIIEIASVQKC